MIRDIVTRFDGVFALDCWVIQGGEIALGQSVEVTFPDAESGAGVTRDPRRHLKERAGIAGQRSLTCPSTSNASFRTATSP